MSQNPQKVDLRNYHCTHLVDVACELDHGCKRGGGGEPSGVNEGDELIACTEDRRLPSAGELLLVAAVAA